MIGWPILGEVGGFEMAVLSASGSHFVCVAYVTQACVGGDGTKNTKARGGGQRWMTLDHVGPSRRGRQGQMHPE